MKSNKLHTFAHASWLKDLLQSPSYQLLLVSHVIDYIECKQLHILYHLFFVGYRIDHILVGYNSDGYILAICYPVTHWMLKMGLYRCKWRA